MKRFKQQNPLYRWLTQQNNKVVDESSVSSDSNDGKSDDPDELTSVVCDGTKRERVIEVSIAESENSIKGDDPNELTSVVCDGTKRGSDDPDELTSVVCDGTKRERVIEVSIAESENSIKGDDPNELTSVVCDGTKRGSDDPNELTSVIRDGTKRESIMEISLGSSENSDTKGDDPNGLTSVTSDRPKHKRGIKFSLASSDQSDNKGDDPNELTSVIRDGTQRESIIQVSLGSPDNSDIKGDDPNGLTSVTSDRPKHESIMEIFLGSSDSDVIKRDDPNELTSVTCGSTNHESIMEIFLGSSDSDVIKRNDPNEVTPVTCDTTKLESTVLRESTQKICEEITNITAPRQLTTVSSEEFSSAETAPNQLTTEDTDGLTKAATAPNQLTTEDTDGLTKAATAPNQLTTEDTDGLTKAATAPNQLTTEDTDGLTKAATAPNQLTTEDTDGLTKAATAPNQLTTEDTDGLTKAATAPSQFEAESSRGLSCAESAVSQLTVTTCGEFAYADNKIKRIVYLILTSLAFRIFGVVLVFLDVSLIIADQLSFSSKYIHWDYHKISLSIALFFLMDVLLRVFIEGIQLYFADILNSLDALIITATLVIDVIYFTYDMKFVNFSTRLTTILRPLRLIILLRIFHLIYQKRHLEVLTRRIVSGNKRRYTKDGFDLDLTYVTDHIIAMSFPSTGQQSFYRNPMKEVVRFLDTKHRNHYQVYNLCSERGYDPKCFHHRVHRIKIDDHNVPSLSEMVEFSKEVLKWMSQDHENVVVIHCKGGKGRTGTMVCACLIAAEIFLTAEESLRYFGERRTDTTTSSKFQGVETPSQSRYVGYFADVKNLHGFMLPPRKLLIINTIVIHSIHGVGSGDGQDLEVHIIMLNKTVFSCSASKNCKIIHDVEANKVIIHLFNCPHLYDDVKVKFFCSDVPKYYDNCPFFFWFNTSFIQNNRLYLSRSELDNPHKTKTWKIYRPEFAVEMCFDNVEI